MKENRNRKAPLCGAFLFERILNPAHAVRGQEAPPCIGRSGGSHGASTKVSPSRISKEKTPQKWGLFLGLPERIRTFDLQSRSLTRYPAVPRVDIKFDHPIIAYLQEKSNPFLKKSRRRSPPFQPLLSDENPLGGHLFSLWKTPPLPVDFSTKIPKSFPQVVEKSVDISAVLWKNPHKIRHFGGFSQLKSNFGGVDNYQTDI